jgi:ethanolamine utilization cobalamin adenosyltransferase
MRCCHARRAVDLNDPRQVLRRERIQPAQSFEPAKVYIVRMDFAAVFNRVSGQLHVRCEVGSSSQILK